MKKGKKSRGPEPERLHVEGDWEEAVSKALNKPKPDDGWPDSDRPGESASEEQDDEDDREEP